MTWRWAENQNINNKTNSSLRGILIPWHETASLLILPSLWYQHNVQWYNNNRKWLKYIWYVGRIYEVTEMKVKKKK